MTTKRLRLLAAGLVAFVMGMPMAEEAMAGGLNISGAAGGLVSAITNASSGQS